MTFKLELSLTLRHLPSLSVCRVQVLEAGLLAQPPAGAQLPHQRAVRGGPAPLPPHRRRRPPARPVPGAQPGPQQLVQLRYVFTTFINFQAKLKTIES